MTTPDGRHPAIAASRVIGTAVHNTSGEKIGRVEDVMLDKHSSSILFAVVGLGGKLHAIPWSALDYSEAAGGYVVPFSREQLAAGPAHDIELLTGRDGHAVRDASYGYYKVDPYWS